jgi:hypothetical protein
MAEQQSERISETLEIKDVVKEPTIDSLVYDILTSRLHQLQKDTTRELEELKERQKEVQNLHDLIAKINSLTDKDGKVTVDEELEEMLQNAVTNDDNSDAVNDLKISKDSLKIVKKGDKYKPEDRQRLIENVRMHVEDLNTQNDMQLQTVTQFTNERYETYQMARAINKPYDEDKKQKARAISGR